MAWWQLNFICNEQQVSRLSQVLDHAGAMAVTLRAGSDEPLCESEFGSESLWKVTRLTGLFSDNIDVGSLVDTLGGMVAPKLLPPYTVEVLPARAWSSCRQSYFQPFWVGERLWIGPSWHQPPADSVNVVLDPGRAFGTGTHATTGLCLEWLASADVHGAQVIDYGCGSGILASAALKLGARHVFAVDTDPNALGVAQENASRNGVEGALTVLLADALPPVQADLLVANILAEPLMTLAPRFAALVGRGGSAVLSGILEIQADAVVAACERWFRVRDCTVREGWVRIVSQRRTLRE